jgi:hypothetical protein
VNLAICASFRNEAPYLREWIEFHKLQGVEHFYLYNNRSEDDWQAVLKPYINTGMVEVTEWKYPILRPNPNPAIKRQICAKEEAYQQTLNKLKGQTGWLAFLDIDEFLFSPRYDTVLEALNTTPPAWGGVGVSWMCFGAGDETEYRDAPVIERFTWRPNEDCEWNVWFKTIVRLDHQPIKCRTVHTFDLPGDTHLETGAKLTTCDVPPPNHAPVSHLLRINHYFTKSRPEWELRHPRNPGMTAWCANEQRWNSVQVRDVDDRTIWKWLPRLKEKLKVSIARALKIDGWMSTTELEYLAETANKSKVIIEVGSWMGRSTCAMAVSTYGKIYAVDTWKGTPGDAEHEKILAGKPADWLFERFRENVAGLDNIEPVRLGSFDASDALWRAGVKADMIFIDGEHTEEGLKADIRAWRHFLADGGILCGHDFADWGPGVKKAVGDLIPKFRVVPGTSIWTTEGA